MSFPSHFPMVRPPRGDTVNHWESLLQALLQALSICNCEAVGEPWTFWRVCLARKSLSQVPGVQEA